MNISNIARWGIGLCLLTAILITVSCASTGTAAFPGGSVTWDYELKTYTIDVPAERCWSAEYLDVNGSAIDTTGPQVGSKSGHMPEGTVSFDYTELDCDEPQSLIPTPGSAPFTEEDELVGASFYRYLSATVVADPLGSGELFTLVDVFAFDENQADQRRQNVAIGQPLPPLTTVHALVSYDVVGADVLISSALPTRFGSFTAELDGVVVAEPGNGVITTGAGNGWVIQTASLPMAYFAPGNNVTITQTGRAPGSAPTVVAVDF